MENEYRSTKMGDIQKCPNCGAVVESLTGKCKECGYEFRNVEVVNSAQKFSDMLQEIEQDKLYQDQGFWGNGDFNKMNRIALAIKSFPVPTGKEDLYNFLTMLQGLQEDLRYGDAYKAKYKECLIRVKTLFPNDDLFKLVMEQEKQLEQERLDKEKSKVRKNKIINIVSVISVVIGIIALIGGYEDMGCGFLFGGICVFFYGKMYMLVSQRLKKIM